MKWAGVYSVSWWLAIKIPELERHNGSGGGVTTQHHRQVDSIEGTTPVTGQGGALFDHAGDPNVKGDFSDPKPDDPTLNDTILNSEEIQTI